MTRTCIICKKQPIPYNNNRSFHKFPHDNVLKQKWLDAIGKTSMTKNSVICSDHFTNESFHQTDGYTTLRRLLPNAIPNIIGNSKELTNITRTITVATNKVDINSKPEDNIGDSEVLGNITGIASEPINKDNIGSQPEENDSNIEINNRKRPYPFTIKNWAKKKFYFKDGVQTECVTKADLVSDAAWERFLKLMIYKNNQISDIRKKNLRKDKKIDNLTIIIEKLKKIQNLAAAKYLQVFN